MSGRGSGASDQHGQDPPSCSGGGGGQQGQQAQRRREDNPTAPVVGQQTLRGSLLHLMFRHDIPVDANRPPNPQHNGLTNAQRSERIQNLIQEVLDLSEGGDEEDNVEPRNVGGSSGSARQ